MYGELTTRQAAEKAGVTPAYIRYLLAQKTLQGRKLDGWQWLVNQSSLERWMAMRSEGK